MWILVEVGDQLDVGVDERRRFLLRKHIRLSRERQDNAFAGEYHIDECMTEVHPATEKHMVDDADGKR